jgi:hypothetical protein|tara:strand:+ start:222 stop:623 length:402 start_codon:yes stop_codon:yes gene_type:complete
MKIVIASFILQSLLFSQSSIAQAYDCPSAQTQISNGSCVPETSSSEDTLLFIVAGIGIYLMAKMIIDDAKTEESDLISQEINSGYGLRLNRRNTPVRISTLRPITYDFHHQISNEINAKNEHGLAILDLNYSW